MALTILPDWNAIEWTETPDRVFFGMWKDMPVVKVVCRERTYIIPACHMSKMYRHLCIDKIEHATGEQQGITLP